MAKYLFTSDQRISELTAKIKWVADYIQHGNDVCNLSDKSENNNAATLKFYYNLHLGTDVCKRASVDPLYAIRNFVLKFQFPNTRTEKSFNDSLKEKMLLAPFRHVVTLLFYMAKDSDVKQSELSLSEILYFIFCNSNVYTNPIVNYSKLIDSIKLSRISNMNLDSRIEEIIEWKQYGRQCNELMQVLTYASSCFKLRSKILCFSLNHPSYNDDKDFINEIIDYNRIWIPSDSNDFELSTKEYISYMDTADTPYNVIVFNKNTQITISDNKTLNYRPYITAIKSKPFLLLAGISGTGKSRIVRELARACWEADSEEYKSQKPKNFAMIQVKPNWHDSSELIGYVSRVSGEPEYVAGDFLKFIAKAWENLDVPHFLCLDEMNLAPVEQYFAEYLSVIESRKNIDGEIVTDAIIEKCAEQWYFDLTAKLTTNDDVRTRFMNEGITIPKNLIVVGTVNMDETTFSFSRKVLDRAMTIEMNEVDLEGGLDNKYESIGKLGEAELIGYAVEGVDVYADNKEVCDTAISYLKAINEKLEGTPFKVAYRTRNEFLLYVVNNLPYNKDENGEDIPQEMVIARALDEITNMKILSRIEGDETKVSEGFLNDLRETIKKELNRISQKEYSGIKGKKGTEYAVSLAKLKEMTTRLGSGYTSFWS